VTGVRLMGEVLATAWLKEVMTQGTFNDELRRWALAPLSAPPAGQQSRGKIICNCLDVSENEIIDTIQLGADFATLQNKLKCGTECGSCVPELKRLVKLHHKFAA
jgi:assimilatory nitrate reductase catalytic subunit